MGDTIGTEAAGAVEAAEVMSGAPADAAAGAGAAGTETATETTGTEGATPNGEPEGEEIKDGEVKGLTPEAQTAVNARIGKITRKAKEAQEKLTAAETRLQELEARGSAGLDELAVKLGLHAEYVKPDEIKVIERYDQLRRFKRFCAENRGGIEANAETGSTGYTAGQIAVREMEIDEELATVGGRAREIRTRVQQELRADLTNGRKLRASGTAGAGGKPAIKPPVLPGPAGAGRKPTDPANRAKAGFDPDQFAKEGGGKAALTKQYENMFRE